jgi:hypothetical protein
MGQFRTAAAGARKLPKPQPCRCERLSYLRAGHDRVMTSALRGGVLDHPEIPAGLKPQPLRPNSAELNWQPVGSIPVSATIPSKT